MLFIRETFREPMSKTGVEYKVTQIFLKAGTNIYPKRRLCEVITDNGERVVIKAQHSGVVRNLLIKIDDVVKDGSDLVELEACSHPTLMGNICCDCGVVLEDSELKNANVVSMLHTLPDLKIKKNVAEKLGKEDITNLLAQKKLVLLVDLDQTLIHTTNDNIPPNLKDVYHFQINTGGPWYHTRLRPHTKQFLEKISKYFELHICTFGVREYAHYIAHFLDPDRKLFGQRILSRNECLDQMSKKANLSSLFPCGDNLVCIIDDRSDVWNFSPNVVQVVPYHFFRHTGDINAPQGLQKKENDDEKGFDFENLKLSGDNTEVSDVEESDRKNYSSDSDSDKESKEVTSDSTSNTSVIVPNDKLDSTKTENDEGSNSKEDMEIDVVDTKETSITANTETNESTPEVQSNSVESLNNDTRTKENGNKEEEESKEIDAEVTENETNDQKNESIKQTEVVEETKMESQDLENEDASKQKELVDVTDNDDFLLYLEDILKKVHKAFFIEYEKLSQEDREKDLLPDLKRIIPSVRREVLKGVNIVFSGVVPQQMKLRDSKAYFIGTSFGANVSERLILRARGDAEKEDEKLINYTTHMVAANVQTEKVHRAKKHKSIKIVTPSWLWTCAERWEHVEERLFPLNIETEKDVQRVPPHHCYCPDPTWSKPENETDEAIPGPSSRTRTPSGSMLGDVNPLMFFSPDEKDNMANEVEQILSDESDDEEAQDSDEDEEEEDSDDDDIHPMMKKFKGLEDQDSNSLFSSMRTDDEAEKDEDSPLPSVVFREGGGLPSDDSDEGIMDDEGDLSRMGADLESLLD